MAAQALVGAGARRGRRRPRARRRRPHRAPTARSPGGQARARARRPRRPRGQRAARSSRVTGSPRWLVRCQRLRPPGGGGARRRTGVARRRRRRARSASAPDGTPGGSAAADGVARGRLTTPAGGVAASGSGPSRSRAVLPAPAGELLLQRVAPRSTDPAGSPAVSTVETSVASPESPRIADEHPAAAAAEAGPDDGRPCRSASSAADDRRGRRPRSWPLDLGPRRRWPGAAGGRRRRGARSISPRLATIARQHRAAPTLAAAARRGRPGEQRGGQHACWPGRTGPSSERQRPPRRDQLTWPARVEHGRVGRVGPVVRDRRLAGDRGARRS